MKIKTIRDLSSQMIETLVLCWNDFLFLVRNSYNFRVNTRDKAWSM